MGRGLGDTFGLAVGVGLAVAVGVAVGVRVTVAVGVGVNETVGVGVTVAVAVGVGVAVAVEQGVPWPWHQVILTLSTRQPSLEAVVSLAIRQRSLLGIWTAGRLTTVVIKPSESPLQARRPAIGLPRSALMVRL